MGQAGWAGLTAIAGALLMLVGAALLQIAGVDLDTAVEDRAITNYLIDAAAEEKLLIANLSVWIAGVTLLAVAGASLSMLGDRAHPATSAARTLYAAGAPLAVAAFVVWFALIKLAAGTVDPAADTSLAETLAWIATRADWIATIMLVAAGPALLSLAGRGTWVPRWLAGWGAVAAIAGILTAIAIFAGGLTTYGLLVVPVGVGWTIAAGVVALRTAKERPAAS